MMSLVILCAGLSLQNSDLDASSARRAVNSRKLSPVSTRTAASLLAEHVGLCGLPGGAEGIRTSDLRSQAPALPVSAFTVSCGDR